MDHFVGKDPLPSRVSPLSKGSFCECTCILLILRELFPEDPLEGKGPHLFCGVRI